MADCHEKTRENGLFHVPKDEKWSGKRQAALSLTVSHVPQSRFHV
jgi:hypothetical protein